MRMSELLGWRTRVALLALLVALGLAGCASSGAGGTASPSPTALSTTSKTTAPATPTATTAAPSLTAAATAAKPSAPTAAASETRPSQPTAAATQTGAPSPTAVATATRPPAPTVAATATPQAPPKGAESGPAPALSGSPTRRNEAGRVTIDVTWKNPTETAGSIAFKVTMDIHSVDLDKVDLGKVALLRNDQGREVKPEAWDAPAGGHHREGTLLFPSRDGSGSLLVSGGVKAVELVIRDVAGVKERVLRWEMAG